MICCYFSSWWFRNPKANHLLDVSQIEVLPVHLDHLDHLWDFLSWVRDLRIWFKKPWRIHWVGLVGWLLAWLLGWLLGWLAGWLVGWLVGRHGDVKVDATFCCCFCWFYLHVISSNVLSGRVFFLERQISRASLGLILRSFLCPHKTWFFSN